MFTEEYLPTEFTKSLPNDKWVKLNACRHPTKDGNVHVEATCNFGVKRMEYIVITQDGNVYREEEDGTLTEKAKCTPGRFREYYGVTILHTQFLVHTLVAWAFVPGRDLRRDLIVDHKDNNTHNNDYRNLQWITKANNNRKRVTNIPEGEEAILIYHPTTDSYSKVPISADLVYYSMIKAHNKLVVRVKCIEGDLHVTGVATTFMIRQNGVMWEVNKQSMKNIYDNFAASNKIKYEAKYFRITQKVIFD